jgi:hypothetical protein
LGSGFRHLDSAAFLAITARRSAESFAALAWPPIARFGTPCLPPLFDVCIKHSYLGILRVFKTSGFGKVNHVTSDKGKKVEMWSLTRD